MMEHEVKQVVEDAVNVIAGTVPEYTELEKQRIKERWEALTPEQKQSVLEVFRSRPEANKTVKTVVSEDALKQAPIKEGMATLTYKQLAQNYNKKENSKKDGRKIKVETTLRRMMRSMNKKKRTLSIVNRPGSTIKTEEGTFFISKKGKSIRIGD